MHRGQTNKKAQKYKRAHKSKRGQKYKRGQNPYTSVSPGGVDVRACQDGSGHLYHSSALCM